MNRSTAPSALRWLAAFLTGVVGFMAFNVFDTVFGVPEAIAGLVAWIAVTIVVFRRSPARGEALDA
jgi:uncharacterized membrane protein YuzA (DUF378 family)